MEITDNALIDTEEDFDFLTDEGYERCLEQGRQAKRDGYIELPGWFPGGLPDYDWQIFGMNAYMKPKPKLRHIIRYWWFGRYGWWYNLKWNWEKKRIIAETKNRLTNTGERK